MAIADELALLKTTKASIKQSLVNKDLQPTDTFSTYPTLIDSLIKQNLLKQSMMDQKQRMRTLYI